MPTVQEKQGKLPQKFPFRQNTGNLEILPPKKGKTQGLLFAQVVNSLILKVKDISIFALKISKSAKSVCENLR